MAKKAEAYKQYEEAATLELLVSRLPEVARAVAEPISNVKEITIIDTEGANKLTRVTANTVGQLDSILESFTGSSLSSLVNRYLEGKTNGEGKADAADGEIEPAPKPPPEKS